jgi:hypothetical protein
MSSQTSQPADAETRRAAQKKGQAMPGKKGNPPRYPILARKGPSNSLEAAIRAVGRGSGDHSVIRRYIMRVARAKGWSADIPDNWNSDGSTS